MRILKFENDGALFGSVYDGSNSGIYFETQNFLKMPVDLLSSTSCFVHIFFMLDLVFIRFKFLIIYTAAVANIMPVIIS